MGTHSSFLFFYPRSRVISAAQALERCNTGWGEPPPEWLRPHVISLGAERATVLSQHLYLRYAGPSGSMGGGEGRFGETAFPVDLASLPDGADRVHVGFEVDIPLPPGLPHPLAEAGVELMEEDLVESLHLDVYVKVEGELALLELASNSGAYDCYLYGSRPVRRAALEFAESTGSLLTLMYRGDGDFFRLTEDPDGPAKSHPGPEPWNHAEFLRVFGVELDAA